MTHISLTLARQHPRGVAFPPSTIGLSSVAQHALKQIIKQKSSDQWLKVYIMTDDPYYHLAYLSLVHNTIPLNCSIYNVYINPRRITWVPHKLGEEQ